MKPGTPDIDQINSIDIQNIKNLLETAFNKINRERMSDVPIINNKIKVNAIGFRQWNNSYLGILVTPWFMNLMLLPGKTENWDDMPELGEKTHIFPSGKYKFLTGHEPGIGKYQMCSLFSPMFEFADNEAAVETAEAAINELMNTGNIEQNDIDSAQIEKIWNGEEELPDLDASDDSGASDTIDEKKNQPTLAEKMEQPLSRREMLRGALMLDDRK
ncbi:MAG: [NiFe]-hydrogenase assembly chaperone HybE [Planctomycetia bacterium]|nr:[NiFe]-hydrogenase assembly chaperone HybE [Planctomycetia bacterium]